MTLGEFGVVTVATAGDLPEDEALRLAAAVVNAQLLRRTRLEGE